MVIMRKEPFSVQASLSQLVFYGEYGFLHFLEAIKLGKPLERGNRGDDRAQSVIGPL